METSENCKISREEENEKLHDLEKFPISFKYENIRIYTRIRGKLIVSLTIH